MNLRCTFIDRSVRTFSSWNELFCYQDNIVSIDCSTNLLTELPEFNGNFTNLKKLYKKDKLNFN